MFIVWLAKTTDRIIVFVSSVAEPVFFWDLASGLLKFLQLRLLVQHFSLVYQSFVSHACEYNVAKNRVAQFPAKIDLLKLRSNYWFSV